MPERNRSQEPSSPSVRTSTEFHVSASRPHLRGRGGSQNWKPRGGAQAKPEVRTAGTAVHNICARVLATACFRVTKTSCNWAMYCEVAYNCAQLAAAGNMLHGRGIIGW